jgi:DNA-binding transcriptional regulator LsrR (DeoR family)
MRYQEHLTVKVATLYYLKNLSQEEIAAKLGLSRQSVGRHLKYAREKGVVEFRINSPQSSYSELESELDEYSGPNLPLIPMETCQG